MSTRLRAVVTVLLAVWTAAVAACGLRVAATEEPATVAASKSFMTSSTTTTTTEPTTTTIALPQPAALPFENYIDEPRIEIGRLQIPAIGLDEVLYQGLSLTSIDLGPSHWPGTALPGRVGNVVIAGHRVTHSRPFRHLDQLLPGDHAVMTTAEGSFMYEFTGHEVVTPDRIDIANQTYEYRATMYACHPPGSARYRIVAYWNLISAPVDA